MSSRRIGSYQITDYVGSGGFGSVFKAEDVNTPGRIVAIKELHKKHTRNQVIKQRFFQEAVAMARLDHPNLPRLFTFGEDNGSYYLVMEFISGKLLSEELHESPLPADSAVSVLTQTLDAVSYAHRNGIIHRDLKPDNIMLIGNTGSLRIKVLDFGIARMVGGENLTLAGEGFGTPAYMAPERMSGAAGDDPRMDLYAAGIILFEMLSGKAPFESKATDPAMYWVEMRELHQRQALPSLATLGIPEEVQRIAQRATAKRLEDRYQSADEMLDDLRKLGRSNSDAPTVVLANSQLLLKTSPGGAEVYVDDVLRGTSDSIRGKLLVEGLSAGLHRVRVLKEGFNEYRINVSLDEGRQTDLQVAIPARATVAMPPAETTAADGLATLKFEGADQIKTALLTVESLPAGTALFIGSQPVGSAGEDGRATLKLSPGEYEIRAATPTGEVGRRRVTVTSDNAASAMTTTVPFTSATVTSGAQTSGRPHQSARGKQLAAAAVVVLLLALVAVAYFVLRGPDRSAGETASTTTADAVAPPAAESTPSKQPDSPAADEEKPNAGDARRQAERDAAAAEAQKKSSDAAKTETKPPTQPNPSSPVTATQPVPAPPPPAETAQTPSTGKDGCVLVTVLDPDGQPAMGVRVGLMNESTGARVGGRTGPKGHWLQCGLPYGNSVRVGVLGPMGILNSQSAVISAPRNFVTLRIQRRMDETPQRTPDRPRPYRRRP